MNTKTFASVVTAILVIFGGIIVWNFFIGENDVQNWQVIQSPGGAVRIQSKGGWYFKIFDKVWTYPKTDSSFFSNVKAESRDGDGVVVRFKNKGGGTVSCNVITRYFTDDVTMKKLHEYCGGDLKKLDNILLARIKEHAANEAAKIDSSAAIENREAFANNIRTKLDNDIELKERGIIVESFAITSIDFDAITDKLFEAQRNADLQKRSAEAEEANLIMQKKKTEAQAAQKIAEVKGVAEAEKMKVVTDAERQAELAKIEAEKRVTVEKLAKEEAEKFIALVDDFFIADNSRESWHLTCPAEIGLVKAQSLILSRQLSAIIACCFAVFVSFTVFKDFYNDKKGEK